MEQDGSHVARLKAAAGWYAELQDEDLAADVWRRFVAWEQDPANAAAFREIEASLEILDRTKLAQLRLERRKRVPVLWIGACVATAALAAVFVTAWPRGAEGPHTLPPETYVTLIGERKKIVLTDGSSVTLNTGSRLEVAFSGAERRVHLAEGQALFDVVSDDRPFVVEAGGNWTTALGTEFDIRLEAEETSITLLEGRVAVTKKGEGQTTELIAGQRLQVRGGEVTITEIDLLSAVSWKTGMIRFRDATLAEAIAEMNRYSETKLLVNDLQLAGERLSGAFPAGDQEMFLESILLHLPVQVERSGNTIFLKPVP